MSTSAPGALFDACWQAVKAAEAEGELRVETALDLAARLPEALFVSMIEAVAEGGDDPAVILIQVDRLHEVMRQRLRLYVEEARARTREH